jgi:hypothetical protein
MTYKELINEVLIRLREDTIGDGWDSATNLQEETSVSDYQKMIGALVNDAKRNVESYHDWLNLRTTTDITTVASTKEYNLNSGQEIKVVAVTNQSTGNNLVQVSRQYMNSLKYPTEATGEPQYYAFNGTDASNNLKIEVSPVPTEAQTITFDIVTPQATFTLPNTVLSVPEQPVVLGTWMRAIAERGEDGGSQTSVVAQEFKEAINQAIIRDSGNTQYETDWIVN